MSNNHIQAEDNIKLLNQMMNDMDRADELYRPTNYWEVYQQKFLPELRQMGLADFRRRTESVLASFGATDRIINGYLYVNLPRGSRIVRRWLNYAVKKINFISLGLEPSSISSKPQDITNYFYWYVKEKFNNIDYKIEKCPTSLFGNPEDLVLIEGKYWSLHHLLKCSMFADVAKFIDFKSELIFCELGSGMGRIVEILAHLHKKGTFIVFDIPPQLYVLNQYLTKVFGNRVVGYSEAIDINPLDDSDVLDYYRGNIIVLPTWLMPAWSNVKIDLFWNSASFQEMEPNVVENYLGLVVKMDPKWIYINALPSGNYWGKWTPGRGGTKKPVTEKIYNEYLNSQYTLQSVYKTDYFLRRKDYQSYIYKRKNDQG